MSCGYVKSAREFPKTLCYVIILWDRAVVPQIWYTDSLSHWVSQVKSFAEQKANVTAFRAHPATVVEEVEYIPKTTTTVKIAEGA